MTTEKKDSALKVQEGIEQPSPFNADAVSKFKKRKQKLLSRREYVEGICSGNRTILSQAITLVESILPSHHERAQEVIEDCLPLAGKTIRIGITGVPGVGKSSFIEALGKYLTHSGHKLAVLAIDPSSQLSRGSILGDKTRMEELATDENAFIRPSPSAGSLGGVARKTRESIILCEAAGFDTIFVETVGVGQSETSVFSMVDFFLLLMLAGAGDELQGIKRGIMEMADGIVINKADGDNIKKALRARSEYEHALHLFPPAASGWTPRVDTCSAMTREGIERVWKMVMDYVVFTRDNGFFNKQRYDQNLQIFLDSVEEGLRQHFFEHQKVNELKQGYERDIVAGNLSPYVAAQRLLSAYLKNQEKK